MLFLYVRFKTYSIDKSRVGVGIGILSYNELTGRSHGGVILSRHPAKKELLDS